MELTESQSIYLYFDCRMRSFGSIVEYGQREFRSACYVFLLDGSFVLDVFCAGYYSL
jgi:hypothetical protein